MIQDLLHATDQSLANEREQARAALRAGVLNILLVGAANFDNGRTHLCVADMLLADLIGKMLDDHFAYSGETRADYIPQTQSQAPQGDLAKKMQEALKTDSLEIPLISLSDV